MPQVPEADLQMRQRPGVDQLLVHIGVKGQLLNINVMAEADKPLAPFVGFARGARPLRPDRRETLSDLIGLTVGRRISNRRTKVLVCCQIASRI